MSKEEQKELETEEENQVKDSDSEEQAQVEDLVVEIKQSELDQLKKDVLDYKDKYLRVFAEFENARKRNERDRVEMIKYATGEVMVDVLNMVDDFERSLDAARNKNNDPAVLLKGSEMVLKNMNDLLKRNGVKPMECIGKPFDPNHHEALMQAPSEEYEDGVIMEEFQKGYFMGEKVVRTAKVKVAKNS